MKGMFLKATLNDGTMVISEFSKLGNPQRYALQVLQGVKTFNVWRVVSTVHPASGDACLLRQRQMISGRDVRSIEQVEPTEFRQPGDLSPASFQPVAILQKGQFGNWKAPNENTPAGAVPGVEYPIKREPASLMRYVTLKVASDGVDEVKFFLDQQGPTDGDDDAPPVGDLSYTEDDDDGDEG
jgi:hypothetical protein